MQGTAVGIHTLLVCACMPRAGSGGNERLADRALHLEPDLRKAVEIGTRSVPPSKPSVAKVAWIAYDPSGQDRKEASQPLRKSAPSPRKGLRSYY